MAALARLGDSLYAMHYVCPGIGKVTLKSQYSPPPDDVPEWDAMFQGAPFVLAADMDLRRVDAAIRAARAQGHWQIAMAALEGQAERVLFPRYRDTGLARVFVLTAEAVSAATGRKPAPYSPPRTQFMTSKGDVADAPLIISAQDSAYRFLSSLFFSLALPRLSDYARLEGRAAACRCW